MIPENIIQHLGLQNHRTILDMDILKTEVADWETKIGTVKVMDTEYGYPIRDGCLYFMVHHNGGIVYVIATNEFVMDHPEMIISELKHHIDK